MTAPLLPDRDAELDPGAQTRRRLEAVLWECKRVVVGQDAMLERLIVALLAGGHVLLEGVPGLAKTLTVRTLARVLGGSFARVQFTPDLVPADFLGTRIWRPDRGEFATELGPVFANLLLADEINRTVYGPGGEPIPVPPDPDTLRAIAATSGGTAYTAADSEALAGVYEKLGSRVGTRDERREVTANFAAAGLLFFGGGVGTGLRRRARLA